MRSGHLCGKSSGMKGKPPPGQEAPMVIGPRDVARLMRQISTRLRKQRRNKERVESEAERDWAERS
jgi:hypothetical protein